VAYALSTGLRPRQAPAGAPEAAASGMTTPPEALGRMPQRYSDIKHPVVAPALTPPPSPPVVERQLPPAAPKGPTPEELAAEARRKALEAAEKAWMSAIFFPPSSHSAPPPQAPERLHTARASTPPGSQGHRSKSSDIVEQYFAPQAEKREFLAKAGRDGKTV